MRIKHLAYLLALTIACSCGSSKKKKTSHTTKPKTHVTKPITEVKEPTKEQKEILESTSKTIVTTNTVDEYIDAYKDIAMVEMQRYGIPASITLAQAILESGSGKGELTLKANNHFGIKCHTGWTGEWVTHDDDLKGECFRKYTHPNQSFEDHSLFLAKRSRYAFLFDIPSSDYKGWAKGLKKAGYATDPKYPNKLISLIDRYNLTQYDKLVAKDKYEYKEPNTTIAQNTNTSVKVNVHVVGKGDTLYNISKRYNTTVEAIKKLNHLKDNNINLGQELKIP